MFHIALRQRETHLVCLSCSAESATKALSLALDSVPRVFHLALRRGSTSSLSHVLELYGVASVAPMWFSIVLRLLLRQCETHLVCLSCSAESATDALSLALLSVPRVFHLALRACETLWSAREIDSTALSVERERHTENVFLIVLRQCETHSQRVSLARWNMRMECERERESVSGTLGGARETYQMCVKNRFSWKSNIRKESIFLRIESITGSILGYIYISEILYIYIYISMSIRRLVAAWRHPSPVRTSVFVCDCACTAVVIEMINWSFI